MDRARSRTRERTRYTPTRPQGLKSRGIRSIGHADRERTSQYNTVLQVITGAWDNKSCCEVQPMPPMTATLQRTIKHTGNIKVILVLLSSCFWNRATKWQTVIVDSDLRPSEKRHEGEIAKSRDIVAILGDWGTSRKIVKWIYFLPQRSIFVFEFTGPNLQNQYSKVFKW